MSERNKVSLINYSRPWDISFCVSHAAGAVFGIAAHALAVSKTLREGDATATEAALIYTMAFILVYTISALYHGLLPGKAKAFARRLDHMAIPILLAGTATPCALITLYNLSPVHGIVVFSAGWLCAAFGVITKLFFFNNEKMKIAVIAAYFVCGGAMLLSAVPLIGSINKTAFLLLVFGSALYSIGAVFCRIGIKHPPMHLPFHIFVLAGSIVHFFTIYHYVL